MTDNSSAQPLKVFLCHASSDKPKVRQLYKYLCDNGFDAWLDEEKLLPGHDWQVEIPKAVRAADAVIVCLSKTSINKEGYVQKEIVFALDIADEKPEGKIYLIPARLEDCKVPDRLSRWHWVDLFAANGGKKLLSALFSRVDDLKTNAPHTKMDFVDVFSYGDAEPIPAISTMDDEDYYSSPVIKKPVMPKLSIDEKKRVAIEFHKIMLPTVGALSGFGATLTFSYFIATLAINTSSGSGFMFIFLLLVAVLTGGVGSFYLNEYYQTQNIPIWFRYLSAIAIFYILGLLLDFVSCIMLPILLIVGIGFLVLYLYKEKG